ncbi:MAG: hypothetical protein Q8Q67_03085 [bacterium]|nr:hypothetical protein [bacterium]
MMKGKSSPYLARRAKTNKRVKVDYQRKTLNNPFFRQRREKKETSGRSRKFFILIITTLILAFAVYILFFSSTFAIQKIQVNGVNRVGNEQLIALAWQQADQGQHNLLLYKTEDLYNSLMENFSFDSLRVYKKWPHTLVISAGERDPAFVWRYKGEQHFSDSNGCLIRETAVVPADLSMYPVLEAADNQERLNARDCLTIESAYLQAMFILSDKLKAYPELKVDRFLLEGEANTLKADLNLGPNILFNVKEDADKQLNKLIIIKQDKPAAEFNSLEYIDLRYGDRAYFK